jgi:phospholipid/cholesterol/gamma-HCH transport system substrate-binding protein
VAVGRVSSIDLADDGWTAEVTMLVNGDVHLPGNAVARLEQSSLLGEKYVALAAPADGTAQGTLTDGAVIPVSRTNRNPEVEEVLGALSLLLNGGGIDQIHTITTELNAALSGNEPQIRSMLTQVDRLVSNLDDHRQDITAAIDGVNRLSATLASRDQQIGGVLDNLTPGLRVLDQQRDALVTLLRSVDTLSGVAVDTINKSRDDLVADLRALTPTLQQLANAGQALPQALEVLLTFPFPDEVLNTIKGDYLNIYLSVAARPGTTVIPPVSDVPPPTGTPTGVRAGTAAAAGGPPLPLPVVDAPTGTAPTAPQVRPAAPDAPSGGGSR